MDPEQRGSVQFRASKRSRISHIQHMHANEVNQNARDNDDPAFINEGNSINVIPQIDMPNNGDIGVVRRRGRRHRSHNCARNFYENIGVTEFHLPRPKSCWYCYARLFHHESKDMCCRNWKTIIPIIQCPSEMLELLSAQTREGAHFKQHIRVYNHVFSFTSMGVHIDETLATGGSTFTFRAQGYQTMISTVVHI